MKRNDYDDTEYYRVAHFCSGLSKKELRHTLIEAKRDSVFQEKSEQLNIEKATIEAKEEAFKEIKEELKSLNGMMVELIQALQKNQGIDINVKKAE